MFDENKKGGETTTQNKKGGVLTATGLGLLFTAGASFADAGAPDVSAVVTAIGYATVAGATIGVAYLGMVAGIRLYKWVRSAM